jgi:hypothetical protein
MLCGRVWPVFRGPGGQARKGPRSATPRAIHTPDTTGTIHSQQNSQRKNGGETGEVGKSNIVNRFLRKDKNARVACTTDRTAIAGFGSVHLQRMMMLWMVVVYPASFGIEYYYYSMEPVSVLSGPLQFPFFLFPSAGPGAVLSVLAASDRLLYF